MKTAIAETISALAKKDDAPLRDAWLVAATFGVCSDYGPKQAAALVAEMLKEVVDAPRQTLAKTLLQRKIANLFAFTFDYIADSLPDSYLAAQDVAFGVTPSALALEFLQHPQAMRYAGLPPFPEYVKEAERLGILSEEAFYALANVGVAAFVQEARAAVRVTQADPGPERGAERFELAQRCCDTTAVLIIAILYLIRPVEGLENHLDHLSPEILQEIAPRQFAAGQACQVLSMLQNSCMYMLREESTAVVPRDFVIAIMEMDNTMIPQLRHDMQALAERHPKNIPFGELPEAYQWAMRQAAEVLQGYTETLGSGRQALFDINARLNIRASHPSRSLDKDAFAGAAR